MCIITDDYVTVTWLLLPALDVIWSDEQRSIKINQMYRSQRWWFHLIQIIVISCIVSMCSMVHRTMTVYMVRCNCWPLDITHNRHVVNVRHCLTYVVNIELMIIWPPPNVHTEWRCSPSTSAVEHDARICMCHVQFKNVIWLDSLIAIA